jgi:hypothetical protein
MEKIIQIAISNNKLLGLDNIGRLWERWKDKYGIELWQLAENSSIEESMDYCEDLKESELVERV